MNRKADILPKSLPPRGLSRGETAAYIGVSATKFDEMVRAGVMPPPKKVGSRNIWDLRKVDACFDAIPGDQDTAADDDSWSDLDES